MSEVDAPLNGQKLGMKRRCEAKHIKGQLSRPQTCNTDEVHSERQSTVNPHSLRKQTSPKSTNLHRNITEFPIL